MLYVQIKGGKAVRATTEFPQDWRGWENRGDWKSFEAAQRRADQLNKAHGQVEALFGELRYVAIDNGAHVSPRYDVIEAPQVGERVSYSFNGDSYPDGEIVSITPRTLRVIKTDTGSVYYRRRNSGSWIKKGGTWSLIKGHVNERNPSF